MLETGDRAPQFLLDDVAGRARSAVENRVAGKPVILLFSRDVTHDFSPFSERIGAFKDRGATLFVISGADATRNSALQQSLGPEIVVLADDGSVFLGDRLAFSSAAQLQLALQNRAGGAAGGHHGHAH